MKTVDIRALSEARLSGRFDPAQEGFPMMWSGACAELRVRGGRLDARILCEYETFRPYLSFEVDGLRAQTFSPLPGAHWYTVFLGMDASAVHSVRIALETQAFSDDPRSYAALLSVRADGAFEPLPPRKRRIEVIGDSITSGEGLRGPHAFNEWVPMCFGASDTYERLLGDLLDAQVQAVCQSGWGLLSAWDNPPIYHIPAVYGSVCGPAVFGGERHGGGKPYAFDFDPDIVVINLGTNDAGAMDNPAYTDPKTGKTYKQRSDEAGLKRFEDAAAAFLKHLHAKNPNARLYWTLGGIEVCVEPAAQRAVERAFAQSVPARYVQLTDMRKVRDGLGSRQHPGVNTHKRIARDLARAIQEDETK